MAKRIAVVIALLIIIAGHGCTKHKKKIIAPPINMQGDTANCEYSILTFTVGGAASFEVDINGLPVQTFYGAQLLRQSCNLVENWEIVQRRGVSFADIFDAAGIDVADSTPVNIVPRDGWDVWRTMLACDPLKIPNFGYYSGYAYVYVGSPGLKDPSLPLDDPDNFAKDPHYPEYEGKSLCVDYNHDSVIGAAEQAAAMGMDIEGGACFGSFRYSMLEKIAIDEFGIIEVDPLP